MPTIKIIKADLALEAHQRAIVALLNAYAQDPMGDGKPLSDDVKANLATGLRDHPTTLVFLAMRGSESMGIAVCFRGFSTFAAKPLINIHDLYVDAELRGQGVGRLLLEAVEQEAHDTRCCKLTLEVQENNSRAQQVYEAYGFSRSTYVEAAGGALFLSKAVD